MKKVRSNKVKELSQPRSHKKEVLEPMPLLPQDTALEWRSKRDWLKIGTVSLRIQHRSPVSDLEKELDAMLHRTSLYRGL